MLEYTQCLVLNWDLGALIEDLWLHTRQDITCKSNATSVCHAYLAVYIRDFSESFSDICISKALSICSSIWKANENTFLNMSLEIKKKKTTEVTLNEALSSRARDYVTKWNMCRMLKNYFSRNHFHDLT
jgi:hypothetical protein